MTPYLDQLTFQVVMDTILFASKKKNLFLGVDELMKANGTEKDSSENAFLLAHNIGIQLNLKENLHVLITTLDQSNSQH